MSDLGQLVYFFVKVMSLLFGASDDNPLDEYVHNADPHFSFRLLQQYRGSNFTTYVLNMTSQKWKTDELMDHSVWWHHLAISVPDEVLHKDTALLLINGDRNTDSIPDLTDWELAESAEMAVATGSVVADLRQVPNQPIMFYNDPALKKRNEDNLVAWTWKLFYDDPSDPEVLLQLPMTKAAVRGMDAITEFMRDLDETWDISKYVVTGTSKRGWIAWLTAAVDKRVIGAAPVVLDCLNFVKNLHHHYRSLGGWSFAFWDYYAVNFTALLTTAETQLMADIIDPLKYNSQLKMPKYISTAAGDQFFLVDDSHYYFDQLTSPKYLNIMPNTDHALTGYKPQLYYQLRVFYLAVITGFRMPQLSWTREQTATGGRITLITDTKPSKVEAFHATTLHSDRRDFRLTVLGSSQRPIENRVIWEEDGVTQQGDDTYVAEYDRPDSGWLGFFIRVTYPGPEGNEIMFTSEVCITPDTLPFPECSGEQCRGTLL